MEIFQKKEAGTVFMKYVVMNSSQKWLHFMMVTLITSLHISPENGRVLKGGVVLSKSPKKKI